MLPLHLSQLFTGISGFSCIFVPSPPDTLSKVRQKKSHSVFLQYLLLSDSYRFFWVSKYSFSFFQEPESSVFIFCQIVYLFYFFVDILSFSEMRQVGDQKVLKLLVGPFFGSQR